jgi:glycerol-3-phosphate dehydrogenase (NAD(P)+)
MKISVIGAGGWGTALALVLNENGHKVTLFENFPEYAKELERKRENVKFLKGVTIPETINITNDFKYAVESAGMLVLAVPSHIIRPISVRIKELRHKGKIFVSVAKGIEQSTLMTMSSIIKEVLGNVKVAVLSGPSHAEEVGRKVPTTVVVACKDIKVAGKIQRIFSNSAFRVYSNDDVLGVELGGSLKNVIAIAAGVLDGLGAGDNTKAALITRGLAEMKRLGVKMGAKADTFYGLSGIGDLVVTCESKLSRNRSVGEQLGRGRKLKEILSGMEMVAEGVKTSESVYKLSRKYKVEMPITEEVYNALYMDKSSKESLKELMTRKLKSERDFLNKR